MQPMGARGWTAGLSLLILAWQGTTIAGPPTELDGRLAEVSRLQAEIHTLRATFVQRRHLSLLEEELVSRGRFAFKRPDRIRWEVHDPTPVTMVISEEGLFVAEPGAAPTRLAALPVSSAEVAGLVTGSIAAAQRLFHVHWHAGPGGSDVFEFRPRSRRLAVTLRSVTVHLAPHKNYAQRIVLDEAGGDRIDIAFDDVEINRAISDDQFVLGNESRAE